MRRTWRTPSRPWDWPAAGRTPGFSSCAPVPCRSSRRCGGSGLLPLLSLAGARDDEDEDDFEEDFDEDEDFDEVEPPSLKNVMRMLEQVLGRLPPKMAKQMTRALAAGEDPMTAFARIVGQESPAPSRKGTSARVPPPQQCHLF